jgi:N4-gp56 family major capsid protein
MADLTNVTTLVNGDVFDPQVVSDMINAKVEKKAVMTGYIKVDSTLQGVPGSTVTVPKWGYIGEAVDLEEGQPIDTTKMAFTTAQYGIKKIGKGVMLTDEAQLSGYGNPTGTATNQIALSISEKLDNDRVAVLYESKNSVDKSASVINYNAIVDGVDMFNEEEDSAKVVLIHSKQKTQLRKDDNFISADKYDGKVMSTGAIGRIAGVEVVVSNKVKEEDGVYYNPIIKLNNDAETEDDMPAITYFLKRGNLVEHAREEGVGDKIVCTAHGMPALTNEAKVVILKTKAVEGV